MSRQRSKSGTRPAGIWTSMVDQIIQASQGAKPSAILVPPGKSNLQSAYRGARNIANALGEYALDVDAFRHVAKDLEEQPDCIESIARQKMIGFGVRTASIAPDDVRNLVLSLPELASVRTSVFSARNITTATASQIGLIAFNQMVATEAPYGYASWASKYFDALFRLVPPDLVATPMELAMTYTFAEAMHKYNRRMPGSKLTHKNFFDNWPEEEQSVAIIRQMFRALEKKEHWPLLMQFVDKVIAADELPIKSETSFAQTLVEGWDYLLGFNVRKLEAAVEIEFQRAARQRFRDGRPITGEPEPEDETLTQQEKVQRLLTLRADITTFVQLAAETGMHRSTFGKPGWEGVAATIRGRQYEKSGRPLGRIPRGRKTNGEIEAWLQDEE